MINGLPQSESCYRHHVCTSDCMHGMMQTEAMLVSLIIFVLHVFWTDGMLLLTLTCILLKVLKINLFFHMTCARKGPHPDAIMPKQCSTYGTTLWYQYGRHVWRWTSEPERDKSVFGVASMSRLSGFRVNETGDARANVQLSPPPTFVNLVTIGSLITHQILAKLVNRILRYGGGGGGGSARAHVQKRARAEMPHPTLTCGRHVLSDPNPHTKFEHNRSSRSWDTEVRSARAQVQRYPTHDLC